MRYAFIEQQGDSHPLQMLCTALQVSDSGFTSWQRSDGPKKWLSDGALLKRIREIHEETKAAYGSPRIYQELKRLGIPVSNATSESFFNSLKNERVHGSRYETRDEARADLFDYVEVFYNRSRRHSALGGRSPAAVCAAWLKIQSEPKLAA